MRRAARILPAYWVALAAMLVLVTPIALEWWRLPVHLALLHNLVPGEGQALFFVAWTLGIEALFYAFVAIAAVLVRAAHAPRPISSRALMTGISLLWAASIAWSVWAALAFPGQGPTAPKWADVMRLSLPSLLSVFCPGLLIAVAERARPAAYARLAGRPWLALAAVAPFVVAGMLTFASESSLVFDLSRQLWAVAAGLVLIAALNAPAHPLLRAVAPIGLVSYGLYLWHYVVARALVEAGVSLQLGPLSWPARFALVLVLSLPLALASWLLVERPLLRRTARWRRREAIPLPAA